MSKTAMVMMTACLLAQLALADVYDDLADYHYGDSPNVADEGFKRLSDTPAEQLGAVEAKLIRVVSNPNATQDGKAFACRMLQRIGTEKCIPALSGLLKDDVLSHYARLVLQRMEDSPKAAAVLREALDQAPVKLKVGILGSVGELRDPQAVPAVQKLAASGDRKVAAAAMMALGKIGNPAAATALEKLRVRRELNQAYLDALIACARRLGGSGAAALYRKVLASQSRAHQVAAMRGMAAADPNTGGAMIVDALKGYDVILRKGALGAVVAVKGPQLTRIVANRLADFSPALQAELITALGSRGDRIALDPISRYLRSNEAAVRDAAIAAAARLGDGSTAKRLLSLASTGEGTDQVRAALTRMQSPEVETTLLEALGDGPTKILALQVLAARHCTQATPRLLRLVNDPEAQVRKEAWSGLGALGEAQDIGAIMRAVVNVKDANELGYAQQAVKRIYASASDKHGFFARVAGSYDQAPTPIKTVILDLGTEAGDATALNLQKKALTSGNPDLQKAAIQALSAWPNAQAAGILYDQATSASEPVQRILALRGYIGLAGSDQVKLSTGERMALFRKAAGLVKREDEKKLIVSGLPRTRSTAAFGMLRQYMADPAVKDEAALATANLLWETRNTRSPETEALARQLLQSENRAVRDKAAAVVGEWNKYKSYINTWLVAGPFRESGKNSEAVFKQAYPPETGGSDVKWSKLEKGIGPETINLQAQLGAVDNCCAYVKSAITSPKAQSVRLELGSDDSIKAWLNGKLVHQNLTNRGCSPGQDIVKTTLKQGANTLLLKIVDNSGDWGFSCRIRAENGLPIEGLQAAAQ